MSFLKISIRDDFSDSLMRKLDEAGPRAAHALADKIARSTEPFVPFLTGSQAERTQVVGNKIIYPGPYARYLYYGKVMVYRDPPYLRTINGKQVLSHYGQKKYPIEKPLKYTKSFHKNAQSHWFDASKAQNMDEWTREAEEAIARELGE